MKEKMQKRIALGLAGIFATAFGVSLATEETEIVERVVENRTVMYGHPSEYHFVNAPCGYLAPNSSYAEYYECYYGE